MSYTVSDLFTRACSLVDSLKNDGTVDTATTADYNARTLTLIDVAQKDLIRNADYFKQYELSRSPIESMYGYKSGFDLVEYFGNEDLSFEINNNKYGIVTSYYFESDSNTGVVYIEDFTSNWNTLATINLSNTTLAFKPYKGAVTGTNGATRSRIRFTGANYYRIINRALFNHSFETGKIPDYTPFVKIQLPTDLKSIDKVIIEYPTMNYTHDSVYKIEWENNRQSLYLDYYYSGKIRIQYKPIPAVLTSFNDTIVIDDITAQAICYFLAMNFVATEQNEYLTAFFKAQYDRLKIESSIKQPQGQTVIKDYYGLF